MDRLDMRETHQHQETFDGASAEEIQAIVTDQPEAKATDKPSNRNTRWFAEVALVKVDLKRMEALMAPNAKEQVDEEKSLADLYRQYNKVRKKHFNGEEEEEVNGRIELRMADIQDAARASKDRLEDMKMEIEVFASELGEDYSGCEVKMRETMHGSLCKRLHKMVREFQAMQLERKEQHKKSIMYQVKLVLRGDDGEALDGAEVDEIVDQCMQTGSDPFAQVRFVLKNAAYFLLKVMDLMPKLLDFVHTDARRRSSVSKHDDFCIRNENFGIKNGELCINNEEICI